MVKLRCCIPSVAKTKMRKTRTSGFSKVEEYHFAMNRMWLSEGKREKNIAQYDLSTHPGAGSSCAYTRRVNHGYFLRQMRCTSQRPFLREMRRGHEECRCAAPTTIAASGGPNAATSGGSDIHRVGAREARNERAGQAGHRRSGNHLRRRRCGCCGGVLPRPSSQPEAPSSNGWNPRIKLRFEQG